MSTVVVVGVGLALLVVLVVAVVWLMAEKRRRCRVCSGTRRDPLTGLRCSACLED